MRRGARPRRVGISGSYGGMNTGDEAILASIVAQLRKDAEVEIRVFSRNARHTLEHHAVDRAIPVRALSRDEAAAEVEPLDVLILGGGGLLYDADARTYLREVEIAQSLSIPTMLYAIGAGPLKDPANQAAVRHALSKVDVITVRERSALTTLESAGLRRAVEVTADPAFLLEAAPVDDDLLEREGLGKGARVIGMSVREPGVAAPDLVEDKYHRLLANAADYMVERFDQDVVFVPMERHRLDLQHAHAVISRMLRPHRARVLSCDLAPAQLLGSMSRFSFVVGMRLHFLIFAAMQGVPFVALPYGPKVADLLDELGLASPPIELVNEGRLLAHIDQAFDESAELRARVLNQIPRLKDRARRNHLRLLDLLEASRRVSS